MLQNLITTSGATFFVETDDILYVLNNGSVKLVDGSTFTIQNPNVVVMKSNMKLTGAIVNTLHVLGWNNTKVMFVDGAVIDIYGSDINKLRAKLSNTKLISNFNCVVENTHSVNIETNKINGFDIPGGEAPTVKPAIYVAADQTKDDYPVNVPGEEGTFGTPSAEIVTNVGTFDTGYNYFAAKSVTENAINVVAIGMYGAAAIGCDELQFNLQMQPFEHEEQWGQGPIFNVGQQPLNIVFNGNIVFTLAPSQALTDYYSHYDYSTGELILEGNVANYELAQLGISVEVNGTVLTDTNTYDCDGGEVTITSYNSQSCNITFGIASDTTSIIINGDRDVNLLIDEPFGPYPTGVPLTITNNGSYNVQLDGYDVIAYNSRSFITDGSGNWSPE